MSGCRRTALWGLAILFAAIGFVWWKWFPSYTFHQKITLTVEANGQEYTASSVTAVTWRYNYPLGGEFRTSIPSLEGEAVHLALPGGKHLFALLKTVPVSGPIGGPFDADRLAMYVFPEGVTGPYWPRDMKRLRKTREIPAEIRPLLVTFDDLSKPESVRKVNPDFLAGTLGSGVKLKSMTLAITDEPVGPGTIRQTLPWLTGLWIPLSRRDSLDEPQTLANKIFHYDFLRTDE